MVPLHGPLVSRRLSPVVPTAMVLAFSSLTAWAAAPEKPTGPVITPAPQTTHFTGPLDSEGYVDFVAALNQELGRGVLPSENAAIPLLQAMGPCERRLDTTNAILKELGAAPWSPGMPDFRDYGEFMETRGGSNEARLNDYTAAIDVPWVAADHPDIAALLAANEKPLAMIAAAVQKPKYYRPMVLSKPGDTLVSVLLPDIQSYRDVARQLKARAMRHLGEGRPLEAQQDLLTMHRLARCVGRGGTLIEALVGIAIDAIASNADNVWAAHPDLTADQIVAYRQQLAALPAVADMRRCLETTERAMCMDVTQAIARGRLGSRNNDLQNFLGFSSGSETVEGQWLDVGEMSAALLVFSVDWNVTMQTINTYFDEMIAAAGAADRLQRKAAMSRFDEQLRKTKSEITTFKTLATNVLGGSNSRGKTFGNVLSTLLMPAVMQAFTAQDTSVARRDLTQVMLALAEYQRREGQFPATLTALSPKYLATVPDDLFAGKPFRYASDGGSYRLYSLGRNERDDGGVMGPNGADDLLMAYPPPSR